MFSNYVAFEIEIEPRSGEAYPIAARGSGGEDRDSLRLPIDEPDFKTLIDRLAQLDVDEAVLLSIGTTLFRALFDGKIGQVYASSRALLAENEALVLRLRIAGTEPEIAALPWEFLVDPDRGPLAMIDAPIVRYLPQTTPLPSLHTTLPLKVLLTSAHTPPPVAVEREIQEVEAALRGLGDKVQITVEPHLTSARFRELLQQEPHIWHFVGHGGLAKDGQTAQLLFEDVQGDPDPVTAMELNILLNRSGLRLVVLNACDSAKLSTDTFRSIAPALIRAQIPAVIAQQFKATTESTRAFVSDFYRSLARGLPLDACMTEGRKAVMDAAGLGQPDWGIPVLYTRAKDGRLFELPEVAAPTPVQPAPAPAPAAIPESVETAAPSAAATPSASTVEARPFTPNAGEDTASLADQLGALYQRRLELERKAQIYGQWSSHILQQYQELSSSIRDLKARLRAKSI
jgi:hypothetical protein